jgi:hypothetical protein
MHLDTWDYLTFASLFIVGAACGGPALLVLGLPGKIAIARKHPDAEAVNLMGWVGFLAVVPWINALIWAFKPTDVIDIRRFPRQEQAAIYTGGDGFAALRRIVIRTYTWINWLYPVPFYGSVPQVFLNNESRRPLPEEVLTDKIRSTKSEIPNKSE